MLETRSSQLLCAYIRQGVSCSTGRLPSQEWGKTAKIYVALQENKQQLSAEVNIALKK